MTYTQEIILDLNPNSAYPIISAKQNDVDSRILLVHYTKDGAEYKVSRNNSVALRLRKPDMHVVFNDCTINDDGTVSVTLSQQCLAIAGRAYADLVEFNSSGQMLSTTSFIINIQASPNVMGSDAVSSDEFLYLKSFIDQGLNIIGQAEEWVNGYNGDEPIDPSNPAYKNNAKYFKQRAEAWAVGTIDESPVEDTDATYENNAKYYANMAQDSSRRIDNMTMSVEAISTNSAPTIEKQVEEDHINFALGIPKSNSVYITFDVDYNTGELVMYRPDSGSLSDELNFSVNSSTGQLEVSFEDGE